MFYQDLGTGRPVIFVHGWCVQSDSWEYVITELLEKGYRCIVYDQRGCGRSDKPYDGYDFTTLAGDLADVIRHRGLEDAILVGHSLGCGVCVRYLSQYEQRGIGKAVLLGTTTPYPLQADNNPDGIPRQVFDDMLAAIKKDRAAYVRDIAGPFFAGLQGALTVSRDLVDWACALTMEAAPYAATGFVRAMGQTDQREELGKITLPVLLLHGKQDASAPIALTAEKTLARLANGKLMVYEDSAHGFYISEAPMICKDMLAFIGE